MIRKIEIFIYGYIITFFKKILGNDIFGVTFGVTLNCLVLNNWYLTSFIFLALKGQEETFLLLQ